MREGAAFRSEHKAEHDSTSKEKHRPFIQNADPGDEAKPQPQFLIACLNDPDNQIRCRGPEQRLERVHGQQVEENQVPWSDQHGDGGQELAESAGAETARQMARQPDRESAGERGKKTDRVQRVAGDMPLEPGDQGDQRRLVNVTPGEVPGAIEVIQFIAKIPVA